MPLANSNSPTRPSDDPINIWNQALPVIDNYRLCDLDCYYQVLLLFLLLLLQIPAGRPWTSAFDLTYISIPITTRAQHIGPLAVARQGLSIAVASQYGLLRSNRLVVTLPSGAVDVDILSITPVLSSAKPSLRTTQQSSMPIIRNPFRRNDENVRVNSANEKADVAVPPRSIDIKEPTEYKLSG